MNAGAKDHCRCHHDPCPLCGTACRVPVGDQHVPDLDYLGAHRDLARRTVGYRACPRCGTVSQDPLPAAGLLADYYASIEMERHVPAAAAYKDTVYRDRLQLLREATGLVAGTCFEVGCGNAVLLDLIRREWGLQVWGLEPSATYDTAAAKDGVSLVHSALADLDLEACGLPAAFDLVICRHVLEHVGDPGYFLDHLAGLTAPAGWLYLEVPSSLLLARGGPAVSGQNIQAVHLHHFTGPGLAEALRQRGLAVTRLEDRNVGGYPSLCVLAAGQCDGAALFREQLARQQSRDREAAARLVRILQDHDQVLIWGAGADLVNVLDHLDPGILAGLRLYDRNPAKQGKSLGGAAVMGDRELAELRPGLILAGCSNRSLVEDIRADAASRFPGVPLAGLFEDCGADHPGE